MLSTGEAAGPSSAAATAQDPNGSNAGDIMLAVGSSTGTKAGDVFLGAGASTNTRGRGGDVLLNAGAGQSDSEGTGGRVRILGGYAAGQSPTAARREAVGGKVEIAGGDAARATGGHVELVSGRSL